MNGYTVAAVYGTITGAANEMIAPFGQLRPLQGGNLARVAKLKEVDHKLSSRQVGIEPLHECPRGA